MRYLDICKALLLCVIEDTSLRMECKKSSPSCSLSLSGVDAGLKVIIGSSSVRNNILEEHCFAKVQNLIVGGSLMVCLSGHNLTH